MFKPARYAPLFSGRHHTPALGCTARLREIPTLLCRTRCQCWPLTIHQLGGHQFVCQLTAPPGIPRISATHEDHDGNPPIVSQLARCETELRACHGFLRCLAIVLHHWSLFSLRFPNACPCGMNQARLDVPIERPQHAMRACITVRRSSAAIIIASTSTWTIPGLAVSTWVCALVLLVTSVRPWLRTVQLISSRSARLCTPPVSLEQRRNRRGAFRQPPTIDRAARLSSGDPL